MEGKDPKNIFLIYHYLTFFFFFFEEIPLSYLILIRSHVVRVM